MVVNFNLADLDEEKDRDNCGNLVVYMELFMLEAPVEANMRDLR